MYMSKIMFIVHQLYSEESDNHLKYKVACIIPGHHSTMHC